MLGVLTISPILVHMALISVVPIIHYYVFLGEIPASYRVSLFWAPGSEYVIDTAKCTIVVAFVLYANF